MALVSRVALAMLLGLTVAGATAIPATGQQGQADPAPLVLNVPVHIENVTSDYDRFYVECLVYQRQHGSPNHLDLVGPYRSDTYDLVQGGFDGTLVFQIGAANGFSDSWYCEIKMHYADGRAWITFSPEELAAEPSSTQKVEGDFGLP